MTQKKKKRDTTKGESRISIGNRQKRVSQVSNQKSLQWRCGYRECCIKINTQSNRCSLVKDHTWQIRFSSDGELK